MAEEFVDLYEVLELPVDADRNTLRKRINELYLDAQRNIDHRNFATRIKYQQLFEVTLPQARYILLDDGRRDEYNRLVHAFRFAKNGPVAPEPEPFSPAKFSFDPDSDAAIPTTDSVASMVPGPLPAAPLDAQQLALEREELWKKWKIGLEEALGTEDTSHPKTRSAITGTTSTSSGGSAKPTTVPKAASRPKVEISFDFGDNNAPRRGEQAPVPGAEELVAEAKKQHDPAELERKRNEQKREIMKTILVNIGLLWGALGAAAIILPCAVGLFLMVNYFYPQNATPLLGFDSIFLWIVGFIVIGVAAFFGGNELSKIMRRKKALELSMLSYDELLKRAGRS